MKFTILAHILLISSAAAGCDAQRACTPAEIALATGIRLNIQAQYGEYNGTAYVEEVLTTRPGDLPSFYAAKGMLQNAVQVGMNLRLFNQQIAPADNPAIAGLAKYAAAEETEKGQVDGLTGIYEKDKSTLELLKSEVLAGIKLNEGNLANATSVCDFTLQFPPPNEMGS